MKVLADELTVASPPVKKESWGPVHRLTKYHSQRQSATLYTATLAPVRRVRLKKGNFEDTLLMSCECGSLDVPNGCAGIVGATVCSTECPGMLATSVLLGESLWIPLNNSIASSCKWCDCQHLITTFNKTVSMSFCKGSLHFMFDYTCNSFSAWKCKGLPIH